MSTTAAKKRAAEPLNGVNVPVLFATLGAVKEHPELARFQFRATNRWKSGTHSQSAISGFYGVAQEQKRDVTFMYDADHPGVLVGGDNGPTPVEFLLHALLACLTAGVGNIAAARGVELTEVESSIEGNINLLGILGLNDEVRNGYEGLKVSFRIKGNAPEEELEKIVFRSKDRSAVYDVLTNGVPIDIEVIAQAA